MKHKKKVLAIFSQLPFPHIDGNRQKVFMHIGILSKHYDTHVVIITGEQPDDESISFLEKHTSSYKIFTFSKWKSWINVASAFFSKTPLQVAYFYFKEVQTYVDAQLPNIDFVFCNLIRTVKYVQKYDIPKFHDMVDSISINYKNSKESVNSLFWKLIYNIEYKRLWKYELQSIQKFNKTFLINYNEKKYWEDASEREIVWLPNGVKDNLFKYNKKDKKYSNAVTFIGRIDYQPNTDAVFWFLRNVYPYLDKSIEFIIIGANPPEKLLNAIKELPNVKVTGFIEDPYLIINSSLALISPMQTGAGMQNKVMEGMALGKLNIVSSLAARAIIHAENGKHFIVEDDGEIIASIINKINKDLDEYTNIGIQARTFMEHHYQWSSFEKILKNTIESNVNNENYSLQAE
jgi:glycosyltransferase involved in cell wall biosynthesis